MNGAKYKDSKIGRERLRKKQSNKGREIVRKRQIKYDKDREKKTET
jgi:hypothetical protein